MGPAPMTRSWTGRYPGRYPDRHLPRAPLPEPSSRDVRDVQSLPAGDDNRERLRASIRRKRTADVLDISRRIRRIEAELAAIAKIVGRVSLSGPSRLE